VDLVHLRVFSVMKPNVNMAQYNFLGIRETARFGLLLAFKK